MLHNFAETPLSLVPLLAAKGDVRQSQHQLPQKVIGWQEAFELVTHVPIGIENHHGRRPLSTEPLEGLRLFFDVNFDGQEILVDELLYSRIGIYLGIQPGAPASHGSRIEIEKQRFVLLPRLSQGGINVFYPGNRHGSSLHLRGSFRHV